MKIFVVGSGKLANAILSANLIVSDIELEVWTPESLKYTEESVIIHAGSGRQLAECIEFCRKTNSVFIELSTGLETETLNSDFTLIVCPNTSVLLLKTLNMLKIYGKKFENYSIEMTESHQSTKTSEAGTAYSLANSLNFPTDKIVSIREPNKQLNEIAIPQEYLGRHAYHKIIIKDGNDEVTIETKVLGHDSYVNGVQKTIEAVLNNDFDKKRYTILDLIDSNML